VLRKTKEGPGGANWYFFEVFNGSLYADGHDAAACTGCHARAGSSGVPGKDFVFNQVD
jgi:hypothetical protein